MIKNETYTIESNELISANFEFNLELTDTLSITYAINQYKEQNILMDYREGLYVVDFDILLGVDMYEFSPSTETTNTSNVVVSFDKSKQVIEVGDIINIANGVKNDRFFSIDNKRVYFKVISTTFFFDGNYKMNIKAVQCKWVYGQ